MSKRPTDERPNGTAPPAETHPMLGADAVTSQVPGQQARIDANGSNPFRHLGGSTSSTFNSVLFRETMATVFVPGGEERDASARRIAATSAALAAFKPTVEIEGMLAAQAVALHFGAMECLRRSIIPEQDSVVANKLRKDGVNLARAMTDMLGALDRKRGKGMQIVRVERVVVNEGGQAIVGIAQAAAGQGDGGYVDQSGGEPQTHADIARQVSGLSGSTPARLAADDGPSVVFPPLRSADPGQDALPVASDAEWPLPDARRK